MPAYADKKFYDGMMRLLSVRIFQGWSGRDWHFEEGIFSDPQPSSAVCGRAPRMAFSADASELRVFYPTRLSFGSGLQAEFDCDSTHQGARFGHGQN